MGWIFGSSTPGTEKKAEEKVNTEWKHKTSQYLTDEKRKELHAHREKVRSTPAFKEAEAKRVAEEAAAQAKIDAFRAQRQKEVQALKKMEEESKIRKLKMDPKQYAQMQRDRAKREEQRVKDHEKNKAKYDLDVTKANHELQQKKLKPIAFTIATKFEHVAQKPALAIGSRACDEVWEVQRKMEQARRDYPTKGKMSLFKKPVEKQSEAVDVTDTSLFSPRK